MEKTVDECVVRFLHQMEVDNNLPHGKLIHAWHNNKETRTAVVVMEEKPGTMNGGGVESKKSNYQVFFSAQRNKIMKTEPTLSFGEVSKKVSLMWKELKPEEKSKYVTPAVVAATDVNAAVVATTTSALTAAATTAVTEPLFHPRDSRETRLEKLKQMTVKQLRTHCMNENVARSSKKETMIKNLMEWMDQRSNTNTMTPTPPPPPILTVNTTTTMIPQKKTVPKRSELEMPVEEEIKEHGLEDEEDYYFHDGDEEDPILGESENEDEQDDEDLLDEDLLDEDD